MSVSSPLPQSPRRTVWRRLTAATRLRAPLYKGGIFPFRTGEAFAPAKEGATARVEMESAKNRPAARVGFLFNHEAVHQVAHCATIAYALSRDFPNIEVLLFVSSDEQRAELERIASLYPGERARIVDIDCGVFYKVADALFGKFAPIKKVAVLRANLKRFAKLDALVTPEKTSAMIKHRFGLKNLKMIYARHGAGDRSLSFNQDNAKFDFLLLPGEKFRKRLDEAGHLNGRRHKIVGYPKFDIVQDPLKPSVKKKFFDNGRKTVLYNPHFDSRLSSWYRFGDEVFEYFYQSKDYNLIFAPHIMLFERLMHVSLETGAVRFRNRIPYRYRTCPHMHIDVDSPALADMTYTMSADIYLGDVSSQVYEFIYEPRPCLFLNAHDAAWQNDPNYDLWNLGRVINTTADLGQALASAEADHVQNFEARQKSAFSYTFDINYTPSSVRAARAIVEYLNAPA